MSFFSDISGFDTNKVKKEYQKINEHQDDYSEVDFCLNDEENISFSENKENASVLSRSADIYKNSRDLIEEYMYNYNLTAEEAKEYIAKNIDTEG